MGRPRTCSCGRCRKCVDRARKAEKYRKMSMEERRAVVARRSASSVFINRRRSWKRHNATNPEKAKARKAVARALASGKLVKKPCEVCGNPEVEGHHDDYSKPLEVRWLCVDHHKPPWVAGRG